MKPIFIPLVTFMDVAVELVTLYFILITIMIVVSAVEAVEEGWNTEIWRATKKGIFILGLLVYAYFFKLAIDGWFIPKTEQLKPQLPEKVYHNKKANKESKYYLT